MVRGEQINPAILIWARETAGLDLHDAARKLALVAGDASASQAKLLEMEHGLYLPTRVQLQRIAKAYRRPLLTFYLTIPPKSSGRGSDFRRIETDTSANDNGLLDAILRDVQARQEMLTNALEDEEELRPLPFVASCSVQDNPEQLADQIRTSLHLSENTQKQLSSAEQFFKFLRARIESMGVYVLLIGDLGSHHSVVSEEVFRGFALADSQVPFIIINDQDAKLARSFTLIHELVHLYLGATGVSGAPEHAQGDSVTARVEQFCNETASYVLLPRSFDKERPASLRNADASTALHFIEQAAKIWTVSEPLVALRLRRLGWITPAIYVQLAQQFSRRWQDQKASAKVRNAAKEGGPNYYTVKQYRLGEALVDAVRRAVRDNYLSHTKAAKILGMKPASVEPMLRHFEKRSYALGDRS